MSLKIVMSEVPDRLDKTDKSSTQGMCQTRFLCLWYEKEMSMMLLSNLLHFLATNYTCGGLQTCLYASFISTKKIPFKPWKKFMIH